MEGKSSSSGGGSSSKVVDHPIKITDRSMRYGSFNIDIPLGFPWLMLPSHIDSLPDPPPTLLSGRSSSLRRHSNSNLKNNSRHFFVPRYFVGFTDNDAYSYLPLCLPELLGKVFHGLNHAGWILVINSGVYSSPSLLNPITRSQINLPPLPLPTFWNQCRHSVRHNNDPDLRPPDFDPFKFLGPGQYVPYIFLAVLSSEPDNNNNNPFDVMVIHGQDLRLAVCHQPPPPHRDRDDNLMDDEEVVKWTDVVYETTRKPCQSIRGLAYSNGHFYAIDNHDYRDNLLLCDITVSPAIATTLAPLPNPKLPDFTYSKPFLVGAGHHGLLLVIRNFSPYKQQGLQEFQVFKLVDGDWLEVHSIDDLAIFLCKENAFAISTNGLFGCTPSCIYYADLYAEELKLSVISTKIVVFSIPKHKRIELINASPPTSLCLWQLLWFLPSFA